MNFHTNLALLKSYNKNEPIGASNLDETGDFAMQFNLRVNLFNIELIRKEKKNMTKSVYLYNFRIRYTHSH